MPRNRDLLLAAGPNVVTPAAANETPAQGPKTGLEIAALHKANIHVYV